jgi:1-acyl-sn-glycerol-3-phosphate acyltransferase
LKIFKQFLGPNRRQANSHSYAMLSITQLCFYFIFHLPLKILLRPKIGGIENIPQRPFILAANHASRVDPFLLCLLPLSAVKRLSPIYFLTAEYYYRRWYLRPILKILGCYPVAKRAWTLNHFLSTTVTKLKAGKVVMLFPEGKVVRNAKREKPRVGIGYLIKQTKSPVLPLHIKWGKSNRPFVKGLILTFGEKIIFAENNVHIKYEEASKKIMDIIYSL